MQTDGRKPDQKPFAESSCFVFLAENNVGHAETKIERGENRAFLLRRLKIKKVKINFTGDRIKSPMSFLFHLSRGRASE